MHAVCLHIVPIPVQELTFCAFSDASFAPIATQPRVKEQSVSRQMGAWEIIKWGLWSSKKIPRVVRSTLSAEAVALSASLDRLSLLASSLLGVDERSWK